MLYHCQEERRLGAVMVECAIILPVLVLLTLGLIVGGVGVFIDNEVAHMSHDTARFASVHGSGYASENQAAIQASTLPTVDETYLRNYAKQRAVLCTQANVQVEVYVVSAYGSAPWSTTNNGTTSGGNQDVVQVTVTYPWQPLAIFSWNWTANLTHTAVLPMSY